jgi:hypothetical protein
MTTGPMKMPMNPIINKPPIGMPSAELPPEFARTQGDAAAHFEVLTGSVERTELHCLRHARTEDAPKAEYCAGGVPAQRHLSSPLLRTTVGVSVGFLK